MSESNLKNEKGNYQMNLNNQQTENGKVKISNLQILSECSGLQQNSTQCSQQKLQKEKIEEEYNQDYDEEEEEDEEGGEYVDNKENRCEETIRKRMKSNFRSKNKRVRNNNDSQSTNCGGSLQNETFGIEGLKKLGLECLFALRALREPLEELVELKKQLPTTETTKLNDGMIDTILVEEVLNWIIKNWKKGRPTISILTATNLEMERELTKAEKDIIIQKLGKKERHWRASLRRAENTLKQSQNESLAEALINKIARNKNQFHGLNKEWQMWLVDTRQCYSCNQKKKKN
ncbi:dharma [Anaeramoeba flamelloides]|uniref:Dharma n=1 Tax=Anaeramoeba flamelloides TaxID=1746091 RepID=A0AAV7Z9Q3_9EUKA|nr:dharma [Anaeramoeba flamelloides]|eukprot:Anaeramoba_flamelloidesa576550_21.p1 GENE.a576550_21~~a576550_21.p1  ORF type:complete len:290 (+),score=86.90 a576550_21:116-985(+)